MNRFTLSAAALISAAGLFSGCTPRGPYVEVDGKKITEADLEKEAPAQYDALRRQYESQLQDMLQELAVQKLLEIEAKSQNKTVDEYVESIYAKASMPNEAEIRDAYNNLRAAGRITSSYGESAPMIADALMQQNGRELIQTEISNLKKKYNFNMPRNEVSIENEPTKGKENAPVVIVEFSDYECPFCQRVQSTTQQLRSQYGDKIKWVFKDFPLNIHPNAVNVHIAGNCIEKQNSDKFWQFFDIVFASSGKKYAPHDLEVLAQSLNVDMEKYRTCLADPEMKKEIDEDIKEGEALGVTGTPAFFINGRKISGAQPLSAFTSVIDQEL